VEILQGTPLPPGWTGKLWAMKQGAERAASLEPAPDYILFTDADIAHTPENLPRLVARAEDKGLVLTSLMARLTVETPAERMLIPAFVFFFAMLYPFAWANDPRRPLAAAAGGCMLVRRDALETAGGVGTIRGEIIDDCSLARLMKRQGPIWLGLTQRAQSLRPYQSANAIGRMVARSAYAQLGFSPWLLAGTVLGMVVVYVLPPALAVFAHGPAVVMGFLAWAMMIIAFQPILKFYRRPALWGLNLPLIGAIYTAFTLQSAWDVWRGRGGMWRGHVTAVAAIAEGTGKGHRDENFPVASVLIAPRHRPVVLAFYRVARMADDVADHPDLLPQEKLRQLALIADSLTGAGEAVADAVRLREVLAKRGLSNAHILDLLEAFRRDAVKSRYASWDELMDYCRYSAAPVGRFMLDVHGEPPTTWPASDALCAALQVINHLQDCGKDYREIDRVYVPLDALTGAGVAVEALGGDVANPALQSVIHALADRTAELLALSRRLSGATRDMRLALEIGVIQTIAESLTRRLQTEDPLARRVTLSPLTAMIAASHGAAGVVAGRLLGRQSPPIAA
jgi:squalene synthase HpnC